MLYKKYKHLQLLGLLYILIQQVEVTTQVETKQLIQHLVLV